MSAHGIEEARPQGAPRAVDVAPVQALVERIVAAWSPQQVWLFGSRARGDAQPGSDWDLLVVVSDDMDESVFDPLVGWRMQRDSGVRADVMLCRAAEFHEDRTTPNTLAYEAWNRGSLLYER